MSLVGLAKFGLELIYWKTVICVGCLETEKLFNPLIATLTPQSNGPLYNQYSDWYTGRWWVGCWYSEEGTGRGRSPPRPLFVVPNITAHTSTASVPTSYYSMWQLPLESKKLKMQKFSTAQRAIVFPKLSPMGECEENCCKLEYVVAQLDRFKLYRVEFPSRVFRYWNF